MDEQRAKKCDVCNGTGMDLSLYRDPKPCEFCEADKVAINHSTAMRLGDRLRVIRRTRNHSLKDLAGITGLSVSRLSDIERGHTRPVISEIKILASGLGVSEQYLITGEEKAGNDIENPIVMKLSDEECGRIIRALRALTATIFYLREHGASTEEFTAWDAANTAALTTRFVEATGGKYSLLNKDTQA